jgi:hypothetical protein
LLIALVAVGGLWSAGNSDATNVESAAGKKVTLVIDFGEGSSRPPRVERLEALDQRASGWSLFASAGVAVEGTAQFPTGFVCRVAGWPSKANQNCADTPSYAEGHWAYYVTKRDIGVGWILSGQGAATHVPECGGYEGWKWVGPGEVSSPPRTSPKLEACLP